MVHAVDLAALFVLPSGPPVRRQGRTVVTGRRSGAGYRGDERTRTVHRLHLTGDGGGRSTDGTERRLLMVVGTARGELDLTELLLLLVVMLLSNLVGVIW